MPTGYTEIIERKPDLTLREFVLRCARAMGACVMQRDEGLDSPPRIDPPDTHYEDERRKAQARLLELRAMTVESARPLFDAEVARVHEHNAALNTSEGAPRRPVRASMWCPLRTVTARSCHSRRTRRPSPSPSVSST